MLLRRLPWDEDQRIMLEDAAPADVGVAAKVGCGRFGLGCFHDQRAMQLFFYVGASLVTLSIGCPRPRRSCCWSSASRCTWTRRPWASCARSRWRTSWTLPRWVLLGRQDQAGFMIGRGLSKIANYLIESTHLIPLKLDPHLSLGMHVRRSTSWATRTMTALSTRMTLSNWARIRLAEWLRCQLLPDVYVAGQGHSAPICCDACWNAWLRH